MAVLTAEQLAEIRRAVAAESDPPITWTKAQIDAATQAIEDWWIANAVSLNTTINAATVPLGITFTIAQKTRIGKFWLLSKFQRGG